eukprot:CAMPEP_0115406022 /NCGR_PEP_ID=MMETSP0271-20121206/18227_1 /TAXON_ID=71861 /ORGANISM="Scrippsiella trochoidea, Strain CCMP3099" /LENGTH=241 /DNA_ID=CAMNT_0002830031 /DNA_START=1 /DNA_END=723 /DNA_ORIENTATION=+
MEPISFVFADRATVPGWLGVDVQGEIIQHLLDVKPDRILLITDETVDSLHGDYFSALCNGKEGVLGETGQSNAASEMPEVETSWLKRCLGFSLPHTAFQDSSHMPMEPISFVFADRATVPGWLGVDVQDEILQHLLDVKPDRILLITDETVDSLHGDYFSALLNAKGDALGETGHSDAASEMPEVDKFILPCGDTCKSWANLTALMEWAFRVGATKRSLVVAFGGGALMNVTGLFASMLYR